MQEHLTVFQHYESRPSALRGSLKLLFPRVVREEEDDRDILMYLVLSGDRALFVMCLNKYCVCVCVMYEQLLRVCVCRWENKYRG